MESLTDGTRARIVQCHDGSFWLVARGALGQLSLRTSADARDFRARYNAAMNEREQKAVIASVIRRVVTTR